MHKYAPSKSNRAEPHFAGIDIVDSEGMPVTMEQLQNIAIPAPHPQPITTPSVSPAVVVVQPTKPSTTAADPKRARGIGDIDLDDLNIDLHYWEHIADEYESDIGDINIEITKYLKGKVQWQSQIQTYFNRRDYLVDGWENAKKHLKECKEAKSTYVNFYTKYK